ncbi:MAG TPA: SOS response-associated peptidase [Sphingomonadales bacterium]|nr:SOS response-associated peptidase [Sphingomonadales bacterium]
MCGRYALDATVEDLLNALRIKSRVNLQARYNIAPGQSILVLRNHPEKVTRELCTLEWGLIPGWAKTRPKDRALINARVETVAEKPSFRAAYRKRRCLIPASGFYEWKGEPTYKQPFYIYLKNAKVFAFAGIWERWQPPGEDAIESAAILTTAASATVKSLHDRMPIIVKGEDHDAWLSGAMEGAAAAAAMADLPFTFHPVSRAVNNVRNDTPELVREMKAETPGDPF